MQTALALLMMLHGVAHLPGFLAPWRLIEAADIPYSTALLNGRLEVGAVGIRAVGLLWLFLSAAFLVAGVAALTNRESWPTMAATVAVGSLVLTLLELPTARIGVVVNVGILVALLTAVRFGWV